MGFEPVDFSEEKKEASPKPEKDKEVNVPIVRIGKLTRALEEVEKVLDGVFSGQSELVPYGIYDKNSPGLAALARMKKLKNVESIKTFLEITKQDFGLLVHNKMIEILKDSWEE